VVNHNYKCLHFFKEAHKLKLEVYKITSEFPKDEKYALSQQLRRACVSITSNIAEGSIYSTKGFIHYLKMAIGSAKEVESQLVDAKDLNYISVSTYDRLQKSIDAVIGPMWKLIKRLSEEEN